MRGRRASSRYRDSYSTLRNNVLTVMKSAAISLLRFVTLNAPFVVIHLPAYYTAIVFRRSRVRLPQCVFLRAVIADTYGQTGHRLEFRSRSGKFSGKMDIVRKAVEIRRGNVA